METNFDFIKWILNNCTNRGLNCVQFNNVIFDLDLISDQEKLYNKFLTF